MNSNYVYLISQLPMLHFNAKPALSFEKFMELCQRFIPEKDAQRLSSLPQPDSYAGSKEQDPVIRQWIDFDLSLRNDLAKIRASRRHVDPAAYLRAGGLRDGSVMHVVNAAQRNPSPLEAERLLDEARWHELDELEAGRFFDFGALVIYAYKLIILIRWEKIGSADKEKIFEETLVKN
ncbi:MAG: hypothetical protein WC532_03885 [Candidatus Omnitrophota bacterium]